MIDSTRRLVIDSSGDQSVDGAVRGLMAIRDPYWVERLERLCEPSPPLDGAGQLRHALELHPARRKLITTCASWRVLVVSTQPGRRLYAQAGSRAPYGASPIMICSPWSPALVMEAPVSIVAPSAARIKCGTALHGGSMVSYSWKGKSDKVARQSGYRALARLVESVQRNRSPHCVEFTRPTPGRGVHPLYYLRRKYH
jgi:hypothetical protein